MKQCKVCQKELPDHKFGTSYHTLSDGVRKAYKDSTCMVCRRQKHLENPDKREVHRSGQSNWYKNNPDKAKSQRLRKYNITIDDYNALREKQGLCCAICGGHEEQVKQGMALKTSYALCIDHCHTTGKIRGLLCTNCNTMIGKSNDNIEVLKASIKYLEEVL